MHPAERSGSSGIHSLCASRHILRFPPGTLQCEGQRCTRLLRRTAMSDDRRHRGCLCPLRHQDLELARHALRPRTRIPDGQRNPLSGQQRRKRRSASPAGSSWMPGILLDLHDYLLACMGSRSLRSLHYFGIVNTYLNRRKAKRKQRRLRMKRRAQAQNGDTEGNVQ